MGLLTCNCLNVKVYVKKSDLNPVDKNSLEDVNSKEEFFSQRISSAHLNLEGIIVQHWSLVKKRECGSLTLHKCINCEMWTHALNNKTQGTSLILVNMAMKEESEISEKSADFSPLYKVVLRDKNDNEPIHTLGVESEKYESLQQTLVKIQQLLNKFLVDEENAMEERIRKYEQSQRSAYSQLQKRAIQDKNNLIRVILCAEDKVDRVEPLVLDNASAKKTVETTSCQTPVKRTVGFATERGAGAAVITPVVQSTTSTVKSPVKTTAIKPFSKSASALTSRLDRNTNEDLLDGQIFDMDPTFADELSSRPFYNSEDEENDDTEDTDDSELDSPLVYSTSVPINVPVWQGQRRPKRQTVEENDDDQSPPDPDNIAASIKALAQSVHNDEAQIFGDLPRKPRQKAPQIYGSSVM